MGQVSVVELLTLQVVTVLAGPQVAGFETVGMQELLIGHSERLTNRLSYRLSLDGETREERKEVSKLSLH